jgi:hypothetical protein
MGAVEMTVAWKWLFAKIDELGIPVAITGTLAVRCDPNLFGGTLRGIGRRRQGTDSASLNGSRLSTTLPGGRLTRNRLHTVWRWAQNFAPRLNSRPQADQGDGQPR